MKLRPYAYPRSPRAAGFTLIELLTVIAIIGILASIIIPVVGKVRQTARVTQSVANLRSIAQAALAYADDNRQVLPALVDERAGGGFGSQYWTKSLEPYLGPAVRSPYLDFNNRAYSATPAVISPLVERHHPIADYGANREIIRNPNTKPCRLSEVTRPSRTVMFAAAETRTYDPPLGSWFIETTVYVADPDAKTLAPSGHGTNNIVTSFVDGHVAQFPKAEFEANRRELLLLNP